MIWLKILKFTLLSSIRFYPSRYAQLNLYINISKTYLEPTNIVLKAIAKGKPEYIEYEGQKAIKVADKMYTI